jgi:hypothetical protein
MTDLRNTRHVRGCVFVALIGGLHLVASANGSNQKAQSVTASAFPDDENGQVLKDMAESGDDLTKPRMVEFQHVFPSREEAIAFIEAVSNKTDKVELSWFDAEESWNVQVSRYMIPTHRGITSLELSLGAEAKKHRGRSDGWGCLEVRSGE